MPSFEVWAQLFLCDCAKVLDLLRTKCGIKRKSLVQRMHITIYYARRPMWGVITETEAVNVAIPTAETRFVVMAPGGENPRPELDPAKRKVGIRVQRSNVARKAIQKLRNRLLHHETPEVLGGRRPSTHSSNAFGARHFQPNMALVRPGNGIDQDLTKLGVIFRREIDTLTFDTFAVEIFQRDVHGSRTALWKPRPNAANRSRERTTVRGLRGSMHYGLLTIDEIDCAPSHRSISEMAWASQ